MISYETWQRQIERLNMAFGEKFLSGGREQILREKISTLDDSDFQNLVDQVLIHKNFAPTVLEILNIAEPIIQKKLQAKRDQERDDFLKPALGLSACPECSGVGLVETLKLPSNPDGSLHSVWFQCPDQTCKAANVSAPKAARWSEKFAARFERVLPSESVANVAERVRERARNCEVIED